MIKSLIKSHILVGSLNKFIVKSLRFNSSQFESLPLFKSELSLDRLYPKSVPNSDQILENRVPTSDKFNGHIPIDKLDISYCLSGGPGGQNANKTNSKVTVKLHISSADWIPEQTKQRLLELHKNNINKEGFWIIRSEKTRTQAINLADCMDKIRCYITEASIPLRKPSIESLEKLRENREKAAIRRLENKKQRSLLKSERRSID